MLSYMHPQSDAVPWTEVDPDVAATDTATITQRQALHQQPPVSFTPWQPSSWELCPPLPTAAMSMALAITLTHQHVHDMHYLTPRSRYDEVKNYIRQRFHLEQDNPFYIHFKVSQPHPRSPLKYYISSQHDLDQYIRLLYKQHLHIQRHQALPPTSPNTSSAQTSSTITSTTTSSMTMTTTTTTTTSSSQSYSNSLFASAYAHATSTEPQASTSTQIHTHTHIPTQIHTHIPIMTPQPNETESDSDALWYDTNLATLYVTVHSDATSIVPDIHTISQARSLATAQATAKAEQQLLKLLSTIVAPPPDSPDEQEPISWQLVSTSSSTVSTPSSAGPSPSSPTLSTNSNSSSNSSTISVSIPDTLMTPLNPLPSIPLTEAIEQAEQIRKREKIEVEKRRLQAQIEAQKLVIHPESATAEPIAEEFFTILNRMAPTQPSGPHPPIKTDASSRRDEMKTYQSMLQQLEKLNQTCPTPNTQQTIRDTRMHDEDEDEDDDDDEHDSRMEKRRKRHRETDGQRYHKLTALFEQLHQLTKSYAMSQQTGDQDCKESSQTRRSSKPTSLIGKGNLLHEATRMITELEQQRAELEHKLRMKEVQAKHLYRKEVNQHMYAIGLAISLQSSQDSSIYHAIMSAGVITSKYDRNGAMLESSFATINTLGFRPEQVMHRVITDSPMFEQAAPIPFDFLHRRQTTRELAREYLPNWSPAQYYRGNSQIEEEGYGEMEYQQQPSPPQPLPIPWWKQWQTLRQPTPFIIRRKTGRPREYVEIVSLRQVVCDSNGEPQFFLSMSNRRFGIYVSQDQLSG